MSLDIGGGSLFWRAGIKTSGLKKDVAVIKGQFAGLGKEAGNTLGKMLSPKGIGITALIYGIKQAAEASVEFAAKFESAMKEVATLSDNVKNSLEDVSAEVMNMTTVIPIGAEDSAKALYQIVSAGQDGADAMQVLEVSAKSAVAGVTDVATAADGITTILNAYNLKASDAENISDQLFTTVKLGKTTFGELAGSIAQVAPLAAVYGINTKSLLASIATLTKSGTDTQTAAVQIRGAIIAVAKEMGPAIFQTHSMQEAFQLVADKAKGMGVELRTLVPDIRAQLGVLQLTGKNAKTAAEHLDGLNDSYGAQAKAFGTMMEDNSLQLKLFSNNLKAKILGPIGDSILGFFGDMARGLNKTFDNGSTALETQARANLVRMNELVVALTDVNTKEADRKKIIDEINKINPDLLKGLDDETTKVKTLTDRVIEYNEQQINSIIIAKEQDKINNIIEERNKLKIKEVELQAQLKSDLADFVVSLSKEQKEKGIALGSSKKIMDIYTSELSTQEKALEISKLLNLEQEKTKGTFYAATPYYKNIKKLLWSINDDFTSTQAKLWKTGVGISKNLESEKDLTAEKLKLQKLLTGEVKETKKASDDGGSNDNGGNNGGGLNLTPKITPISYQLLSDQLKKLKDDLQTASEQDAIGLTVKINLKEKEIADFKDRVEWAAEKLSNSVNLQTSVSTTGSTTPTLDVNPLKGGLSGIDSIIAKYKELGNTDFEKLKESINWSDVFSDLDTLSTQSLENLLAELEKFKDKANGKLDLVNTKALADGIKDVEEKLISKKPLTALNTYYTKYKKSSLVAKKAQANLNDLKGDEFATIDDINAAEKEVLVTENERKKTLIQLNKALSSFADKSADIASIGANLFNTLDIVSGSSSDTFSELSASFGAIQSTFEAISKIDLSSTMSTITTSMAAINTAATSAEANDASARAKENYESNMKAANEYVASLKELIAARRAYLDTLKGEDATTESEGIKKLYEEEIQGYKELAITEGNRKSKWWKHSEEYNISKAIGDLWAGISESAGETIKSTDELANLSIDIIEKVRKENPEAWALLNSGMRDALNSAIALQQNIADLGLQTQSIVMGFSLDDVISEFDSLIKNFEKGTTDVTDSFKDKLKDAIYSIVENEYLNDALTGWYKNLASYMGIDSDGGVDITEAEAAQSKKDWEDIQAESQRRVDAKLAATGVDFTTNTDSDTEESSMTGTLQASVTEETGTALVGLWTRTSLDTREIVGYSKSASETLVMIETNTLRTAIACESLNGKINVDSSNRDLGNLL